MYVERVRHKVGTPFVSDFNKPSQISIVCASFVLVSAVEMFICNVSFKDIKLGLQGVMSLSAFVYCAFLFNNSHLVRIVNMRVVTILLSYPTCKNMWGFFPLHCCSALNMNSFSKQQTPSLRSGII